MKSGILMKAFHAHIYLSLIVFSVLCTNAFGKDPTLSKGQALWVPLYSHYVTNQIVQRQLFSSEEKKQEINRQLITNLVVHNTDLEHPITISKVDYFDSNGKLIKGFVPDRLKIGPMAAKDFFIAKTDYSEGWGAKVLIRWHSESLVNEPIVESVTFGFLGTHSVSFISRGKPIRD